MGGWTNLNEDIPDFLEATGDRFLAKIPRIIELGTLRMAREAPIVGLHEEIVDNMVAERDWVTRPAGALAYRYFSVPELQPKHMLKERDAGFIRSLWGNPTATSTPKYYADFDATKILIGPTPNAAYQYRFGIRRTPTLLSAAQEDNEFSSVYYRELLACCLTIGATYLLDDRRQSMIDRYEAVYMAGLQSLARNELGRVKDAANTPPADGGA